MSGTPSARPIGQGVLVALTTPFAADGSLDLPASGRHVRWLAEEGIDGFVVAGSLGEGAALAPDERVALVRETVGALASGSARVVAAIGATRTREAVELARACATAGATGLLVLPPYAYRPDPREVRAFFGSVLDATGLPAMLYNNPAAYGTDVSPEEILALAEDHANLVAVKESSGDVRRITAIRALLGDRLDVAVGLDDAVVEGIRAGAVGWVAGLANALPRESIALFEGARRGGGDEVRGLYDWFLPLLRMDTAVKFVQQIKLVEFELGVGTTRVRAPRQELADEERAIVLDRIRTVIRQRPPGTITAGGRAAGPRSRHAAKRTAPGS